jgi:hypothetical protein
MVGNTVGGIFVNIVGALENTAQLIGIIVGGDKGLKDGFNVGGLVVGTWVGIRVVGIRVGTKVGFLVVGVCVDGFVVGGLDVGL